MRFVVALLFVGLIGMSCARNTPLLGNRPALSADEAIVASLTSRMASDPETARLSLGIEADNGVVTLSGRIDNPAVRMRALSIARNTDGVRSVVDKTIRF
jgi:osmotically-inducible protein OsmY